MSVSFTWLGLVAFRNVARSSMWGALFPGGVSECVRGGVGAPLVRVSFARQVNPSVIGSERQGPKNRLGFRRGIVVSYLSCGIKGAAVKITRIMRGAETAAGCRGPVRAGPDTWGPKAKIVFIW